MPAHVFHQREIMERARHLFDRRASEIERLLPVFGHAGVVTRYSAVPLEWYEASHGWADRSQLFVDHALTLLEEAATACLERAHRSIAEVDALITVSTTGIATPSLDARLMDRLAFRRNVARLPIFGLGCAGGVLGLARGAALAQAMPGQLVLLLVVELCGLTFRRDDQSNSNIVGAALFGDGAAAALIGCDDGAAEEGPAEIGTGTRAATIAGWGEHTWPGSLDVMGWRIEDDGLGVLFSRDIPTLVRQELGPVLRSYLSRQGLSLADIDAFVCHPGGAKVIEALEETLQLTPGTMTVAREVLRDYGNMSAPTVLFVLERMLAQRNQAAAPERWLLTALGPGFTAGFLTLNLE